METPLVAGKAQIAYLASLIGDPKGDNSRPVQPLGQRTVSQFAVTHTPAKVPHNSHKGQHGKGKGRGGRKRTPRGRGHN